MTKEAPNSPYKGLIFRETFRSDQEVRRNGWNFITIVDTTGTSASAFRLGYDGTNYFKGIIAKCQAYEGVLDLQTHTRWWTSNLREIK